jgi:hypothetical protein
VQNILAVAVNRFEPRSRDQGVDNDGRAPAKRVENAAPRADRVEWTEIMPKPVLEPMRRERAREE